MSQIISWIIAIFAVIGGIDWLTGDHLGLGDKFEKAVQIMGKLAMSMVGIIIMVPLIEKFLRMTAVPLLTKIGVDPAILGGLISIDWGGFFLAKELAQSEKIALYGGVDIAATFGCALCFSIPIGVKVLKKEQHDAFAKGILEGLALMPLAMFLGGVTGGLSVKETLWQSLPITIFSLILLAGIAFFLPTMLKIFKVFAAFLRIMGGAGMIIGVFLHMTKLPNTLGIKPIAEAFQVVAACTISMMGALPMAEMINRALRKPLSSLAAKVKMTSAELSNPLNTLVSGTAGCINLLDFSERGIEFNAAVLVFGPSALSAQLAFVMNNSPEYIGSYLAAKFSGVFFAAIFSLLLIQHRGKKSTD